MLSDDDCLAWSWELYHVDAFSFVTVDEDETGMRTKALDRSGVGWNQLLGQLQHSK